MIFSFTGCADFLKGLTEYRIEKRLETFSDEITEDYSACLEEYSATENVMPEMIAEQKEISDYAFKQFSMTVSSISITDNRKKATISFDICPYCGWEDDGTEDDTTVLGANDLRFSEYKKRYERYVQEDPKYRWDKNGNP